MADDVPVAVVESKRVGVDRSLAGSGASWTPVAETNRSLLRDRRLELRQAARKLGRVVGRIDANALGRLGRRLPEAGASEREVLEGQTQGFRVGELPLEVVEGGLERGKLVVVQLEPVEEVVLGAECVQLLSRELVALGLERDAEGRQLGTIGVETTRERLVGHLAVPLDVRLHVTRGEQAALRHQERDERELPDELVGVVRHAGRELTARDRSAAGFFQPSSIARLTARQAATVACSRCWCDGQ